MTGNTVAGKQCIVTFLSMYLRMRWKGQEGDYCVTMGVVPTDSKGCALIPREGDSLWGLTACGKKLLQTPIICYMSCVIKVQTHSTVNVQHDGAASNLNSLWSFCLNPVSNWRRTAGGPAASALLPLSVVSLY